VPTSSRSGKNRLHLHHAGVENLRDFVGGQFGIGFEQHFARGRVHHVGSGPSAFEIGNVNFDLGDLRLLDFFQGLRVQLAPGVRNLISRTCS
jgi:hypothetical protein